MVIQPIYFLILSVLPKMKNDAGTLLSHKVSPKFRVLWQRGDWADSGGRDMITTARSEACRKYVPVGLGPASLRAQISEKTVASQGYAARSGVYGAAVMRELFVCPSGGSENCLWCKNTASLDTAALNSLSGNSDNAESSAKVRPTRRQF